MANTIDQLKAKLALEKIRVELAKGFWNRWPAGAPNGTGGQFAPKGNTGIGGGPAKGSGSLFSGGWSSKQSQFTDWLMGNKAPSPVNKPPPGPPPGAKPHPKVNDKGATVTINYPSKPSHQSTWSDHTKTAVFTPGSNTPDVLNNVPMKSWSPPKAGWGAVTGTNEKLEKDFPFEPTPNKKVGAGVVVVEPDGRIWLTRPTNSFGGYQNTYPKGTVEDGLTMQQNAIKEAWEETGLKVKITGVLGDYERDTSKARFYLAVRTGGTPKDMGWESQAISLTTLKDARKLLNRKHDIGILDDIEHLLEIAKAKGATPKGGHWTAQPRWPSGSALGGQWKATDGDGITMPPTIAGGLMGSNPNYQKAMIAVYAAAVNGDVSYKNAVQAAIEKYAPANDKFASGVKSTSHVKWGAQVYQYAVQVKGDLAFKQNASATADKLAGPQKLSTMTPIGGKPGGSNPGGMYTDSQGKWLVKGSNAKDATPRSQNEVLASKLMAAAGVGAPDMKLVDLEGKHGGGIGVASKWIEGGVAFDLSNPTHIALAQQDFAVHAWLANYDAIGLGFDNTQIINGKAVNIDPGGALLYRAQGAAKGDTFGNTVTEFESLRKPVPGIPTNHSAHAVYGSMTAAQIADSAAKVAAISDETIRKLVSSYGPGTDAEKTALADKLIARKADLAMRLQTMLAAAAPPAPAPAATPANKTKYTTLDAKIVHSQTLSIATKLAEGSATIDSALASVNNLADDVTAPDFKFSITDIQWRDPGSFANSVLTALAAKDDAALVTFAKSQSEWAAHFKKTGDEGDVVKHRDRAAYALAALVQLRADNMKAAQAMTPPPATPINKPAFNSGFEKADKFYNSMADKFQAMHAAGNLAGLNSFEGMKVPLTYGGKPWKPGTANGTKMATYHAALVADLEKKAAATVVATAAAADKAVSTPVPPPPKEGPVVTTALPNFSEAKISISNSNAESHNKKVDLIAKLANDGDVKGILSLNFGSNTYGKKQAKLANDTLAALGSPHKVQAGQKAGAHTALYGGATGPAVIAAAATVGVPPPAPHPAASPAATAKKPVDMSALDMSKAPTLSVPKFDKSSKQWVNEQNNALAAKINAIYQSGNFNALHTLTYDVIDKETGKVLKQGHMSEHPAKELKLLWDGAIQQMREIANPPEPLKHFDATRAADIAAVSAAFPPKKFGTTVAKVASNEQVGFWVALGKVSDPAKFMPPNESPVSSADVSKAFQDYKKVTPLAKAFINGIQSSGSYNDLFRTGKKKDHNGNDLAEVAKAALAYAQEKPEGTVIHRWQNMTDSMVDQLLKSGPGTVIQATGPMCCSYSPTATSGFGKHNIKITYAKGAKAVDSHGSGGYASEKEITTLPNARFILQKITKKNGVAYVELLMLPPKLGLGDL